MKLIPLLFAATLAAAAAPVAAQTYQSSMSELVISDEQGNLDLKGHIWAPTMADGPLNNDFDSKVWAGSSIIQNAPIAPGEFPLIIVSHGMFGNSYNQAWFAAAMARRGYMVAAINHPGTSTWSRDPDQRRELWNRPKDVSRVIDYATTSTQLKSHIDPDLIYMAGHSLGGFTAALLAGARYDAAKLKGFCDATPGELACGIFEDWNIAQTPGDRAQMEADLSDPRIKAFAVFDLGGTQSFSKDSLAKIDRPMLVFGAPITNSGLTLDIESRALVAAMPAPNTSYIEPDTLSHFDFLGQCKPGGRELLAKEEPGDEIICDNGGANRAAKHQMIIETVADFFANSAQH